MREPEYWAHANSPHRAAPSLILACAAPMFDLPECPADMEGREVAISEQERKL